MRTFAVYTIRRIARRALLPLATLAVLMLGVTFVPLPVAAYSCISPHCYNMNVWTGVTPGAHTKIYARNMSTGSGATANDFVTNEEWLLDQSTAGCKATHYGLCWIEAGFIAGQGYTGGAPRYFIGNIEPYSNNVIVEVYTMSTFPVNSWTDVYIDSPQNDFSNYVVNFDNSTYNQHYSTPISQGFTPGVIELGSELSGTLAAHSDEFDFANNSFGGAAGTFYYQTSNGTIAPPPRDPPSGGWVTLPSQSSTGGYFYSYCNC